MFTVKIIVDVMFGMYLFTFLSGAVNGFAEHFDDRVRARLDVAVGIVLLLVVVLLNSWSSVSRLVDLH